MDFKHLLGLHTGSRTDTMVVCHVDPVVSVYLGCRSNKVLLSYETVQKQLAHHPELPISHYQIVHSALRLGAFHRCNKRPRAAVVLYVDTRQFHTVFRLYVKGTACGREIYLVSLTRINDRVYRKELRKGRRVLRAHQ